MVHSPLGVLLQQLTGQGEGSYQSSASDGQLLERFVTDYDEVAFVGLLCRHGPMVLSVCHRALANEQDREDVFQATFLLLARKADSIRKRESVGSWLHGVAQRLAWQCRRQEKRRRVHEKQAGQERTAAASEAWEELRALLDEAIAELPEKYRSALVLCYLEDHSHEEAARRLGCRLTTLRSRVARGRERLRAALVRRGLTLSSAAFVAALAASAAQAALPASLRIRTLAAAIRCIKGDAIATLVSASTASLVEGGLPALSTGKLKMLLMPLLALSLAAGGAGLLAHQMLGEKNPPDPPQFNSKPDSTPPSTNQVKPAVDRFGDPLPQRAVERLGTVRFRLSGLVGACALSPDGKTLAAGENFSFDHSIFLFDAVTGKPLRQLRDHQWVITSLAYSPDGRTLACGSQGAIALWDPATGKLLRRWDSNPGKGKQVWSLTFTPEGKGLISAGEDTQVHLWDPAIGKEIRQFKGHKQDVRCAVLSPDGRTLASAADKEIRLWETATGKMIRQLSGQKEPIRALAFSPDGKLLASGSGDFSTSSLWLWETATGKVQRCFPEDTEIRKRFTAIQARSLAFSPNGKILAAGYADNTLRLWDVDAGKKLHETPGAGTYRLISFHDGGIQSIVFSHDGKRLVVARDNQLAWLDAATGKEIEPFSANGSIVGKVFFSQDGKRLLTATWSPDKQILEWDASDGRLIRQILPGTNITATLASFSSDQKIVAARGNGAHLWDTTTGKELLRIPPPRKECEIYEIVFSPDGKFLAANEFSGPSIWFFNAVTGKQIGTVEGLKKSDHGPPFLTFSPDGRMLAILDRATIRLAEASSGRVLHSFDLPKGRYANSLAISPDGRTLAIPCYGDYSGQTILLLGTVTGKERLVLEGPRVTIDNVVFSPDGRLLAAGSRDHIVFVWDMLTGKQVTRLEGHRGSIESLGFSPDGRRLASGSRDTTALIWDVSGIAKELPRRAPLTRKELDELWSTLGSDDAAKAYQAILTLAAFPNQTVALLAEHLRPKPVADAKRIARLLTQLDSEVFQERERAAKELREIGWAADPDLLKALEGKPSAEVRRRVMELLDIIREQTRQMLRGVEVLEHIGTPAARKVIAALAEGTPQGRLKREINAALQRLRYGN